MRFRVLVISILAMAQAASAMAATGTALTTLVRSDAGLRVLQSATVVRYLESQGVRLPSAPRNLQDAAEVAKYRMSVYRALRELNPQMRERIRDLLVEELGIPQAPVSQQAQAVRSNNGSQSGLNLDVAAGTEKARGLLTYEQCESLFQDAIDGRSMNDPEIHKEPLMKMLSLDLRAQLIAIFAYGQEFDADIRFDVEIDSKHNVSQVTEAAKRIGIWLAAKGQGKYAAQVTVIELVSLLNEGVVDQVDVSRPKWDRERDDIMH